MKPSFSLHDFLTTHRKKVLALQVALVASMISFGSYKALASGGSVDLVHSCLSPAGLIRIIDPNSSCLTGENELEWYKHGPKRFQTIGSSMSPISPTSTWLDVTGASIEETFIDGKVKVTYSGVMTMSGGNGTAYARIQVRPDGETPFEAGQITMYRFQSTLPSTESSSVPFTLQALVDVPAGNVEIVPQIYSNNSTWGLQENSVLIAEQ